MKETKNYKEYKIKKFKFFPPNIKLSKKYNKYLIKYFQFIFKYINKKK